MKKITSLLLSTKEASNEENHSTPAGVGHVVALVGAGCQGSGGDKPHDAEGKSKVDTKMAPYSSNPIAKKMAEALKHQIEETVRARVKKALDSSTEVQA